MIVDGNFYLILLITTVLKLSYGVFHILRQQPNADSAGIVQANSLNADR